MRQIRVLSAATSRLLCGRSTRSDVPSDDAAAHPVSRLARSAGEDTFSARSRRHLQSPSSVHIRTRSAAGVQNSARRSVCTSAKSYFVLNPESVSVNGLFWQSRFC